MASKIIIVYLWLVKYQVGTTVKSLEHLQCAVKEKYGNDWKQT